MCQIIQPFFKIILILEEQSSAAALLPSPEKSQTHTTGLYSSSKIRARRSTKQKSANAKTSQSSGGKKMEQKRINSDTSFPQMLKNCP